MGCQGNYWCVRAPWAFCLAQFAAFWWIHKLQDWCPQQMLLWLWGVAITQATPEECPRICWRNCKPIWPENPFEAPEASHTAPFGPREHTHLPTQHTGAYRVKKVNLETWLDVLRGLYLITRSPLTCPLGLLKRLLKCLLKQDRKTQRKILSSMVSPPISPNVSPPRPGIDRRWHTCELELSDRATVPIPNLWPGSMEGVWSSCWAPG